MGLARTKRKRQRRRKAADERAVSVISSAVIKFLQWCRAGGVEMNLLAPAVFPKTERGMMAKKSVKSGDMILSTPHSRLMSSAEVRHSLLDEGAENLDDVTVLALFLLIESRKCCRSEWSPYLDVLPSSYSLPVCFSRDELMLLPHHVLKTVKKQTEDLRSIHQKVQSSEVAGLIPNLTCEEFILYWCAVNTRTVYFKNTSASDEGTKEDCALAPFLDFLNHSPSANVEAGYNVETQSYEIKTFDSYRRGTEVFICYGPHSNDKLLVDYGFIVPGNPHSAMPIDLDEVLPILAKKRPTLQSVCSEGYRRVLRQAKLNKVSVSADGCSWLFHSALEILSLEWAELSRWRDFIYDANTCLSQVAVGRKSSLGLEVCAFARDNLLPPRCLCEAAATDETQTRNASMAARLSLEHHAFLDAAEEELRSLVSTSAAAVT